MILNTFFSPRRGSTNSDANRISILIPAYNASSTIGATLISVLMARPHGSEVLVYLDGDSTTSQIMSFAEKKGWIKVFRGRDRQGIANALNYLISKSAHSMVARVDSDDLVLPWHFKHASRQMLKKQLDFVFSNSFLWKTFLFLPQIPFGISPNIASKFLIIKNPFVQSTMIASRSAIISLGGYKEIIAEDYELWLRASLAGFRLGKLNSYGVIYRIHQGQVTSANGYQDLVDSNPDIHALRLALLRSTGDQTLDGLPFQIQKRHLSSYLLNNHLGFRIEAKFETIIEKFSSLKNKKPMLPN